MTLEEPLLTVCVQMIPFKFTSRALRSTNEFHNSITLEKIPE